MLLTRYQGVLVKVTRHGIMFLFEEVNGHRRWRVTRQFGIEEIKEV